MVGPVLSINSSLTVSDEWLEPTALPLNAGLVLVGCFLRGEGGVQSTGPWLLSCRKQANRLHELRSRDCRDSNSDSLQLVEYASDVDDAIRTGLAHPRCQASRHLGRRRAKSCSTIRVEASR